LRFIQVCFKAKRKFLRKLHVTYFFRQSVSCVGQHALSVFQVKEKQNDMENSTYFPRGMSRDFKFGKKTTTEY